MIKDKILSTVMPLIPRRSLSHYFGKIAHYPLPEPLASLSVDQFVKFYKINMAEAEFPQHHYKTVGELFIRRLKPDARPIANEHVVHPCDAKITECGPIDGETLIQAKGHNYSVTELLRNKKLAEHFIGGDFITYYLCPTDYHRVHSPVDGNVTWSSHVPGDLWPVNSWSTKNVEHLFAVNERVSAIIETAARATPGGSRAVAGAPATHPAAVALVMVAATNVGNISITFDPEIRTNDQSPEQALREHTYKPTVPLSKGQEFGVFHMGSTVIALFSKGYLDRGQAESLRGRSVKMGEAL